MLEDIRDAEHQSLADATEKFLKKGGKIKQLEVKNKYLDLETRGKVKIRSGYLTAITTETASILSEFDEESER